MRLQSEDVIALLSSKALVQPKVLLIEDSKFDSAFLKKIISKQYPMTLIDHAETKSESCTLLKQNKDYDIVFLDLTLPDTVGLEDIQEFRTLAKDIPLIVITGDFNPKTLQAAKTYGADGIIGKSSLVQDGFSKAIENAMHNIIQD